MNVSSSKPNPRVSHSFDNRVPTDASRHARNVSKDTTGSNPFQNETVSLTSIEVQPQDKSTEDKKINSVQNNRVQSERDGDIPRTDKKETETSM